MTARDTPYGEDLPGMLAVAKGVAEQTFPHTMDAQVWAREFMKNNPNAFRADIDEGAMLSWFANAIMAGYDTAMARAATRPAIAGQSLCKHDWPGPGAIPPSFMCKCGSKVYRSYEDYCDD